jgi:hypothetical protein
MAHKIEVIDRIILGRHADRGIDFGGNRRVIARKIVGGNIVCQLHVIEGHSSPNGARGFGRKYEPSRLLIQRAVFADHLYLTKGRVGTRVLLENADVIDAEFGIPGLTAQLDLQKTTLIKV